jgi:hypothetical protein
VSLRRGRGGDCLRGEAGPAGRPGRVPSRPSTCVRERRGLPPAPAAPPALPDGRVLPRPLASREAQPGGAGPSGLTGSVGCSPRQCGEMSTVSSPSRSSCERAARTTRNRSTSSPSSCPVWTPTGAASRTTLATARRVRERSRRPWTSPLAAASRPRAPPGTARLPPPAQPPDPEAGPHLEPAPAGAPLPNPAPRRPRRLMPESGMHPHVSDRLDF